MSNCLVTTLKEVVDNNALPKMGHLLIKINKIDNPTENTQKVAVRHLSTSGVRTISVVGDGYLSTTYEGLQDPNVRSKTLDIDAGGNTKAFFFSNGDYYIDIPNKYVTTSIDNTYSGDTFKININELAGISTIGNPGLPYNLRKASGNIKYLPDCYVMVVSGNVYGDIENINMPTCISLEILSSGNVYGDISKVTVSPNITVLLLSGGNIYGEFTEFVSHMIELGAQTKETIRLSNTYIKFTFNGKTLPTGFLSSWIGWDSADNIRVYLSNSNFAATTTIYEKGATAEQIAEWQAAGKTVIDVMTDTVYPPTNA